MTGTLLSFFIEAMLNLCLTVYFNWFKAVNNSCDIREKESKALRQWNPRGGGGTLIFSHIRRLGPFFWVQNSEFQYLWGVLRKMFIFGGYEDFVDVFLGSS